MIAKRKLQQANKEQLMAWITRASDAYSNEELLGMTKNELIEVAQIACADFEPEPDAEVEEKQQPVVEVKIEQPKEQPISRAAFVAALNKRKGVHTGATPFERELAKRRGERIDHKPLTFQQELERRKKRQY